MGDRPDPGAVATHHGREYKEAALTIDMRDLVCAELDKRGMKYITDRDDERLAEYIKRIKPGSGSVLCEIHFNAATPAATGTETLVKNAATTTEWDMAKELSDSTAQILGIANRGVKSEADSHRGKLGVLHTGAGISTLTEVCFISNEHDVEQYLKHKHELAVMYADVLVKYEAKYT